MEAVLLGFDSRLFSADVIVRATHRHTADYAVELELRGFFFQVKLSPKHEGLDASALELQMRNDVLDEQLRERVRAETSAVQNSLIQAALLGASPKGSTDPVP